MTGVAVVLMAQQADRASIYTCEIEKRREGQHTAARRSALSSSRPRIRKAHIRLILRGDDNFMLPRYPHP